VRNPASIILLVLFGISVLVAYLIVRRGRANVAAVAIVGSAIDAVLFMLFSLSQRNGVVQALVVGLVLGIVFNLLAVTGASYFRQDDLSKRGTKR
jgi:hypothetical protein